MKRKEKETPAEKSAWDELNTYYQAMLVLRNRAKSAGVFDQEEYEGALAQYCFWAGALMVYEKVVITGFKEPPSEEEMEKIANQSTAFLKEIMPSMSETIKIIKETMIMASSITILELFDKDRIDINFASEEARRFFERMKAKRQPPADPEK